jgi:hypothetical protein
VRRDQIRKKAKNAEKHPSLPSLPSLPPYLELLHVVVIREIGDGQGEVKPRNVHRKRFFLQSRKEGGREGRKEE